MSNERTRFITIRLDPPTSRGAASAGEDDLAAVLRWLGEASSAGWRVSAHIPQAQMALVVSAETGEDEDPDDGDSDDGAVETRSVYSLGDEDSSDEDDSEPSTDGELPLPLPVTAPHTQRAVRFASQTVIAPPRLRSPSRRYVGVTRRKTA